jgi:2-iminobutanoate/2-iminopropanoate deaminase
VSGKLESVTTSKAPAAVGPYSQAVVAGGFVFASGQIPLDPATGEVVGETFEARVRRVLDNLEAVLLAAGSDRSRVVKATVYLTDMALFPRLNAVYAEFFGHHRPARVAVAVAALPRGADVEIEAVALL